MMPSLLRGEWAVVRAPTDRGVCDVTRSAFRVKCIQTLALPLRRSRNNQALWCSRGGGHPLHSGCIQRTGEVWLKGELVLTSAYLFKTLM